MEVKFNPNYKHVELMDPEKEIPERYLDESPEVPRAMIEKLDEYLVRHFFIACPFKATDDQKFEREANHDEVKRVEAEILRFNYFGTFVMERYGYFAIVNINPTAADKYDRLVVKWARDGSGYIRIEVKMKDLKKDDDENS